MTISTHLSMTPALLDAITGKTHDIPFFTFSVIGNPFLLKHYESFCFVPLFLVSIVHRLVFAYLCRVILKNCPICWILSQHGC